MSFKSIDDRQVINRAALANIGSGANDSLDDIFSRIDSILAGLSGGGSYTAKKVALTNGTTSYTASIPVQPDTSYVVFGMMGNTTDTFPQYQQVEVTNKTTSGFTFKWNHPLDSNSYFISYVIPFKVFPEVEAAIGSSQNGLASTLPIAQSGSGYGVIARLQNTTDANPQFQTVVVGSNSSSVVNLKWNVGTDTSSYKGAYMLAATGQVAISNSSTSVTFSLPVPYSTVNYAIIASVQNTTDTSPQFQPLVITAQSSTSATISWNVVRDSGNYLLNYYAISLTP